VKVLSIGDRVDLGRYEFHSRFNRVVNFANGPYLVSVVNEKIGPGPLNIVMGGLPSNEGQSVSSLLHVAPNVVEFENWRFNFTKHDYYHSAIPFIDWNCAHFRHNLSLFGKLLVEISSPCSLAFLLDQARIERLQSGHERAFANQAVKSVQEMFHGDLLCGIRWLKGCGFGLTPSGDDFIAGVLVGLNLLQKMYRCRFRRTIDAVFAAALGDNVFSNTLLSLTQEGLVCGRMKNLITALTQKSAGPVMTATEQLFAIGASSGADLGTGFFMTVRDAKRVIARWGDDAEERIGDNSVQKTSALMLHCSVQMEALVP
jgi:hypothetical protein